MAERATADRVAADMKPPNYRGAVQRLRTIKAKKEKVASVNGEIAGIYDTVEGFKVNKKAARIFLTLDPLEAPERADIIRSLMGLIDVAEWDKGDLVDDAEGGAGNIIAAKFGGKGGTPKAGENAAGEDATVAAAMDAVDQMPADKAEGAAADETNGFLAAVAKQKAKERGMGLSPPPGTEPYTGDNSDLGGGDA